MSSFCGVTSNKPAKVSNPSTNDICHFKSFQDLERDIKILYDEMICLQPDFNLKSEAIKEWQRQVYENSSQIQLLIDCMNNIQRGLEETECSLRRITRDLEKLDLILKPIEIVTVKIKCACNFDSQRYKLYPQFLECFNAIKSIKSTWLGHEELIKFVKSDNLKDILFYHVCILENIENKISTLEALQEINDKTLKYIQRVGTHGSCSTFPPYL